ncbi:MAG: radical SAM protein [Candidatus Omnitrophica bacterium]|nr:radical SAM protein [Candidatus Omnitrophota bacterium]MBU1925229.1 radical SAM protein [Candidatus Omnitrophota bacterium]
MIEKKIKPGFCCFGITDKCTLRCRMCLKWREDLLVKEGTVAPSITQWKQGILDLTQIVEFPFELDLGGGEALLYDGILDIVSFSVKNNFYTSIASNGYIIDEEMARRIADSGLSVINISLDSIKEKTHDYLRGVDGVYKRVMDAIGYLHKYCRKMPINICCVIYAINQEEILDLIEWANQDERIRVISFMAAMQPNNTYCENNWWSESRYSFLWPKNPKKTVDLIEEIIFLKDKGLKIGNPISQLRAFQAYYKDPARFVKRKQCNLDRAVLVSSVGDIFLCYEFESLGNIKNASLSEIWYSEKAGRVRRQIASCGKNCHHLLNCFKDFEEDFPEKNDNNRITSSLKNR